MLTFLHSCNIPGELLWVLTGTKPGLSCVYSWSPYVAFYIWGFIQSQIFLFLIYLFERQIWREREKEISYLLVLFPNGCNSHGLARLKEHGASSVSPMWVQGPSSWAIFCCLCSMEAGSWTQTSAHIFTCYATTLASITDVKV